MRANGIRFAILAVVLAGAGCADDMVEPSREPVGFVADAARGRLAFSNACSGCHASGDGFDLAFFGFSDTTIIRRAVAHVDTATARDIVAHVRTLGAARLDRNGRLFQPGGGVAAGDASFAVGLFGSDSWPASLTTAALVAIDPRRVRLAIPMPLWSVEEGNVDWMPDDSLPEEILDHQGSLVRAALAGYRVAPTKENLARAVAALRTADRAMANPAAPCLLEDPARVDYERCFQVRRWTSSLVAQHMLRFGIDAAIDASVHDAWWDVGNVARKSRSTGHAIQNAVPNWAAWMVLGWTFDPGGHPSVYTGGGANQLGLARHATFIALRSQVARPARGDTPYEDARQAIRFAPAGWTLNVAEFGFRHLEERQAVGDLPRTAQDRADAALSIANALADLKRKLPAAQLASLQARADRILSVMAN